MLAVISTERDPQERQPISSLELYGMETAATQGLSQFLKWYKPTVDLESQRL